MKSQKIVLFTDEILPLVKNRLIKMRLLLQQKQSEVSNAPQGRLRIIKNHGTEQYYHITEKGNRNGKYIPKENIQLVKSLLQHEYNKKLNEYKNRAVCLHLYSLADAVRCLRGQLRKEYL